MSKTSLRTTALHLSPRAGRGRIALAIRVRGSLRECSRDYFKNARHICQHVVIPESQNVLFMLGKPFVANGIARVVGVLAAIHFNDETMFPANQVNCVRTDWLLANEFKSVQPARPELTPERRFGFRHCLPQIPGTLGLFLISRAQADSPPHPDCFAIRPLPARGERLAPRAIL